jgi:hypothetical protein
MDEIVKRQFARFVTILGRLLRKRLNCKNSSQAPQTGLQFLTPLARKRFIPKCSMSLANILFTSITT